MVRTLAARIEALSPQCELAAALARSIAPDGPDGEPWVVDGASLGLQDSYYTEREGRVVLPVCSVDGMRGREPSLTN